MRIVLKVSGEALKKGTHAFESEAILAISKKILQVKGGRHELVVVVGGGNILRGSSFLPSVETRFEEDVHGAGMHASVANALVLAAVIAGDVKPVRIARPLSGLGSDNTVEGYTARKAKELLANGEIVVLGGGIGKPGVTTDTAAVLVATELKADIVLKGTKVNGVYDRDPKVFPDDAIFFPELTHHQFLEKKLRGIIDRSAVAQAEERNIPIRVFDIFEEFSIARAVRKEIGTLIYS